MSSKTPFASSFALVGRAFQPRQGAGAGLGSARLARPTSSPPRSDRLEGAEPSARVERRVRHDLQLIFSAGLAAALVASSLVFLGGVRVRQVQVGYRVHDLRTELLQLRHERAALDVERSALLRPSRLAEFARGSLQLGPVSAARAIRLEPAVHTSEDSAGTGSAAAHGSAP